MQLCTGSDSPSNDNFRQTAEAPNKVWKHKYSTNKITNKICLLLRMILCQFYFTNDALMVNEQFKANKMKINSFNG